MAYILGLIIASASISLALQFLGQTFGLYVDHVAVAVVIGGTIAVALVVMPWSYGRDFVKQLAGPLVPRGRGEHALVRECLSFVQGVQRGNRPTFKGRDLAHTLLSDGGELIDLRFSPAEIESILDERIHRHAEVAKSVSAAVRSLSKYPPAFGLIGTVFGLVNLMRAITEGLAPREIGVLMATALVATLYGLMLANLVIAPYADAILKDAEAQRQRAEMALRAVMLSAEGASLLKAQELLNSFVARHARVDAIGTMVHEERDAA